MPEEHVWEDFFSPGTILKTMGVSSGIKDVAEFGCGYGTFTIPTAKMVSGKVYALDIETEMIESTQRKAMNNRLRNVETILRDFMADGSGLDDESVDYVMLFNILHLEEPQTLLKEAHRILRPNGKLGIVHWNYDPATPRGPPMEIRPQPEQCIHWAEAVGFVFQQQKDLQPYHYGVLMIKTTDIPDWVI